MLDVAPDAGTVETAGEPRDEMIVICLVRYEQVVLYGEMLVFKVGETALVQSDAAPS